MNDSDKERLNEKKEFNQIMWAYRKAIENIIKKGLVPDKALERMNELKLKRIKKRQFERSLKRLVKFSNGKISKS